MLNEMKEEAEMLNHFFIFSSTCSKKNINKIRIRIYNATNNAMAWGEEQEEEEVELVGIVEIKTNYTYTAFV